MLADGTIALTPFRLTDAPTLMAIDRDPEAARWFDFPPITMDEPAHRAHAEEVIRRWWAEACDRLYYSLAIRRSGAALGAIGLRPINTSIAALSYAIVPGERGQGYATRAVRLIATAALAHLGVARLEIRADIGNAASQRVAERAGFVRERAFEGSGRFHHHFAGVSRDEILYALHR